MVIPWNLIISRLCCRFCAWCSSYNLVSKNEKKKERNSYSRKKIENKKMLWFERWTQFFYMIIGFHYSWKVLVCNLIKPQHLRQWNLCVIGSMWTQTATGLSLSLLFIKLFIRLFYHLFFLLYLTSPKQIHSTYILYYAHSSRTIMERELIILCTSGNTPTTAGNSLDLYSTIKLILRAQLEI